MTVDHKAVTASSRAILQEQLAKHTNEHNRAMAMAVYCAAAYPPEAADSVLIVETAMVGNQRATAKFHDGERQRYQEALDALDGLRGKTG